MPEPLADFAALDKLAALAAFSEPPTADEYRQALLALEPTLQACIGFGADPLRRRIRALMQIARHDLGLARLAEGHLDSLSILHEAGLEPPNGVLYGIWASGGPADTTRLSATNDFASLAGSKPFCSGAGIVDCALIWVSDAHALVEVNLAEHPTHYRWDAAAWRVAALAGIQTWRAVFDALPVARTIGNGDWYFERDGFWLGALCPAACWAGGALGLVDYAHSVARDNLISHAHLGRMLSAVFGMESALYGAALPEAAALSGLDSRQMRALAARHVVDRSATLIIDEFCRLLGPRPLVNLSSIARRIQELQIYQRQCHGEHDLAELASKALARSRAAARPE